MERWSSLSLSLAGRMNSVKMIMPKLLFLFQTISIFIPKSFFKELKKDNFYAYLEHKNSSYQKGVLREVKRGGGSGHA